MLVCTRPMPRWTARSLGAIHQRGVECVRTRLRDRLHEKTGRQAMVWGGQFMINAFIINPFSPPRRHRQGAPRSPLFFFYPSRLTVRPSHKRQYLVAPAPQHTHTHTKQQFLPHSIRRIICTTRRADTRRRRRETPTTTTKSDRCAARRALPRRPPPRSSTNTDHRERPRSSWRAPGRPR